ncbi:MAG TPA: hypothetical protein VEX15_12000 [Nocardioidaceae bacterium]|nr:hypothetical protein [Nocardioidaceae bacterium]
MTTYYRNAAGRVVTTSPWRVIDCWHMTREPDLDAYHVTHGRQVRSSEVST